MTPQERQLIDDLFDRLAKLESAPRDPDAVAAIAQGLRRAPNAVYALVQTVLVQDEALKRADSRIQELEAAAAPEPNQSGGFLDSMRETIFGQGQSHGSVPNVPPPQAGRPVWNSGQVLQQAQPAGALQRAALRPVLRRAAIGVWPRRWRRLLSRDRGGRGGRRDRRLAAAQQHPLDDGRQPSELRPMRAIDRQTEARHPWSDQSGSNLARDAGINDIGSSAGSRRRHVRAPDCSIRRRMTTARTMTSDQDDMDHGFGRFRRRRRQRLRLIDRRLSSKTAARCERPFLFPAAARVRSRRPWRRH